MRWFDRVLHPATRRVALWSLSLWAVPAAAQCTDQQAAATTGRWRRDPHALVNPDYAKFQRQYPALAARVDRVEAIIRQAAPPTLAGLDVLTNRKVDSRTLVGTGHVRPSLSIGVFGFICVPINSDAPSISGRIEPGGETGTWIYVDFNALSWLRNERREVGITAPGGGQVYYALRPGTPMRGVPVVVPEVQRGRGEEAILLTSNDRDPWKPFTRGALVDARIVALQARLDSLPPGIVQSAVLERMRAEIAQFVAARDAMSAEEKSLQALVTNPFAPPASLFVSAEKGGRALVVADRSFFPKGEPKDKVRMILVYWYWEKDNPAKAALIEQFRASLDVEALRELLARD